MGGEVASLEQMAKLQLQMNNFSEAVGCYEEAIAICKEIGDNYELGSVLYQLASAYFSNGSSANAAAAGAQAISLFQKTQSKHWEAQTRHLMSSVWLQTTSVADMQLKNMAKINPKRAATAKAFENAKQKSLQSAFDAATIYQSLGDKFGMASAYQSACNLGIAVGDSFEGLKAAKKAKELYEDIGDNVGLAAAWLSIAQVNLTRAQPDIQAAFYAACKARDFAAACGDRTKEETANQFVMMTKEAMPALKEKKAALEA